MSQACCVSSKFIVFPRTIQHIVLIQVFSLQIQKANVSFEANKLLGETKLVQAQREISSLKVELRQWKTKLFDEGQVSEMLSIEFEKGKKLEEQLAAAQAKCCKLFDRCDVSSLMYFLTEENVLFLAIKNFSPTFLLHTIMLWSQ